MRSLFLIIIVIMAFKCIGLGCTKVFDTQKKLHIHASTCPGRQAAIQRSLAQRDNNITKHAEASAKLPLRPDLNAEAEREKLREQLLQSIHDQQAEGSRQREEHRENREMMERQLEQQKKESQQQKIMMEYHLAQQEERWREQKETLERQLAQQKEESQDQKEHLQEIIHLLRDKGKAI